MRHLDKTVHHIIHKEEIPQDPAISKDRDRFIIDGFSDKPVDNPIFIMGHLMAGTKGVGNPKTGPGDLMDIVVDQDHLLRRQIRDRVNPFWIRRMVFRHR